ncbi:unnamed protein product [Urochloa humidicola]
MMPDNPSADGRRQGLHLGVEALLSCNPQPPSTNLRNRQIDAKKLRDLDALPCRRPRSPRPSTMGGDMERGAVV